MNLTDPRARLLGALLLQTQANEIVDIFSISEESGLDLFVTLKTLDALDSAGLVNARKLRLTLNGLAVAAAHCPEVRRASRAQAAREREHPNDLETFSCRSERAA